MLPVVAGRLLRVVAACVSATWTLFIAYVVGAGYLSGRDLGFPTPLNFVASAAITMAGGTFAYFVLTGRGWKWLPHVAVASVGALLMIWATILIIVLNVSR